MSLMGFRRGPRLFRTEQYKYIEALYILLIGCR